MKPEQALTARAADAPTIAIHGGACDRVLLPLPSSAIRFGDVAAHAHGFEIHERLVAVIPLLAHDLFDAVAVGPDCFDLLGGFNQRFDACRGVSVVGVLHRHADDRAALEVHGSSALFAKCVRPSFIFVIFASGSCGCVRA